MTGTDDVEFWVMSWGYHTLVPERESLKNEVKVEAKFLAGKYDKGIEKEGEPQTA